MEVAMVKDRRPQTECGAERYRIHSHLESSGADQLDQYFSAVAGVFVVPQILAELSKIRGQDFLAK